MSSARELAETVRRRYTPTEIATVGSDGVEIVFCGDHDGEYVGWTPRGRADHYGYTIEKTLGDADVLALVAITELLREAVRASPCGRELTGFPACGTDQEADARLGKCTRCAALEAAA